MRSLNPSSLSRFLVTALLLVAKCSAQFNLTSLPPCDQECFQAAIRGQNDCASTDVECLCADQIVSNSLRYCLETSCSYTDLVAARNFALQYCPSFAPNTTTSSNSSATSGVAAGDSTQAVNNANHGLTTGTKIGIGVVVPVGVLCIIFGILFYRHVNKERKRNSLPAPVTQYDAMDSTSRSRSRSQSRSHSRAHSSRSRSVSVAGKRTSKNEMRQTSRALTPSYSIDQSAKSFSSTDHSRNTSSATAAAANSPLTNVAGFIPVAGATVAGKRGVTFDAELEKTSSTGVDSSNSSTTGSLGKVGSNTNSKAGSSYRSLSPIAEPVSLLQTRPSSASRPIVPPPIAIMAYNNREELLMPQSPPYAQHQSEPLPPPSPATPLHYVYTESDVEAQAASQPPAKDSVAAQPPNKKKSKKKSEPQPRWKQWKDRQSSMSPLSSPTSSTPKLDSMYNAI